MESPDPATEQYPPSNLLPAEKEKTTYVRFLVSNAEAGSVIGKGGSTINDFQSQSGARIQLSRSHETFPGTSDRIIMVSGTIDEVLKAMDLILTKFLNEFHNEDGEDANPRPRLGLVVPNSSCGGIIGKGGSTIKSLIESSQAGIKISPQDNNYYGLNERLITVTGGLDEQLRAVDLILSKLIEDPHYGHQHSSTGPFPYAGNYNAMNFVPNGGVAKFQNNKHVDQSNSVIIGVEDEHIGIVVGRGGKNITEISQISGARIKISDRNDYISGTSKRKVTITGSESGIKVAESMINRKIASLTERL